MAISAKSSKWFFKFNGYHKKTKKLQDPLKPEKVISKESLKTEFQQVFGFFDTNHDGKISCKELRSYFTSMGECLSYDEVQRVISEFDGNGDGHLEFMEFVKLMEGDESDKKKNDEDDSVRRAFEMFEVEKGCGFITSKGVQQVLNQLGGKKSEEECKDMIRVFDLDGNGVLDFNEFRSMMA